MSCGKTSTSSRVPLVQLSDPTYKTCVSSSLPQFVKPCLPSLRDRPPQGEPWLHEIKFDGWRVQAIKSQGQVRLYSRNQTDLTDRLQQLADALRELSNKNFTIDGELIALDKTGAPDFYAIPTAMSRGTVAFCVFDLLHLGKHDTRQRPFIERKELLAELVDDRKLSSVAICDTYDDGEELLITSEKFGFEGIVSKRRHAPYHSGRSLTWIKVKCRAWRVANRERWRLFSSR
jgi:bifunctional non-homologous end joining protein LigD